MLDNAAGIPPHGVNTMLHFSALPVSILNTDDLARLDIDQSVLVMLTGRYADSAPRALASSYGRRHGKRFHCWIDASRPSGPPQDRDYDAMRVLTVTRTA